MRTKYVQKLWKQIEELKKENEQLKKTIRIYQASAVMGRSIVFGKKEDA